MGLLVVIILALGRDRELWGLPVVFYVTVLLDKEENYQTHNSFLI